MYTNTHTHTHTQLFQCLLFLVERIQEKFCMLERGLNIFLCVQDIFLFNERNSKYVFVGSTCQQFLPNTDTNKKQLWFQNFSKKNQHPKNAGEQRSLLLVGFPF